MNKFRKNFIIIISFLFLGFLVTLLSGERAASIMLLASIIIFILFVNPKNYIRFLLIIILSISAIFIIKNNKLLYDHYYITIKKHYFDNHWKAHFLTSIEIFEDNKFLGSGIKSFREECKKSKYENIKSKYVSSRCSNHPHNIYFEFFSDTGIIISTYFLLFSTFIGFWYFISILKKKDNTRDLLIFCTFFILFWPFQTTGSFFSTWNGIFYWISLAFIVPKKN